MNANANWNNSSDDGVTRCNSDFPYNNGDDNNSQPHVITRSHLRRKDATGLPWELWKANSGVRLSTAWWSGQRVDWFGGGARAGGVGVEERVGSEEEWMTAQRLPVEEFD